MPMVPLGEPMRAGGIAQVIDSTHAKYKPGDNVNGLCGWQEYVVFEPDQSDVPPTKLPDHLDSALTLALSVTGLTAYFGMLETGKPAAGQTVLVSGAALLHLAMHARIVLCGAISQYNVEEDAEQYGIKNHMELVVNRGTAQGFIILDYLDRAIEGLLCLHKWVQDGDIVQEIDMQKGFENIPETLARLFTGANLGKQLLKLADAPLSVRTSPMKKPRSGAHRVLHLAQGLTPTRRCAKER